jgi:hypothetical protein
MLWSKISSTGTRESAQDSMAAKGSCFLRGLFLQHFEIVDAAFDEAPVPIHQRLQRGIRARGDLCQRRSRDSELHARSWHHASRNARDRRLEKSAPRHASAGFRGGRFAEGDEFHEFASSCVALG